jgi:predicted  nucleic acid-binding Zn-ribbon protein
MENNIGRYNRLVNTISKIRESIKKEMDSLDAVKDALLIEEYMSELRRLKESRDGISSAWYWHDKRHGIE